MNRTEEQKTATQEKRLILSELSRQAEDLREQKINEALDNGDGKTAIAWGLRTINSILLHHIYDINEAKEFKTFNQWRHEGATVKKGEKAFLIWGQPVKNDKNEKREKEKEGEEQKDNYSFFPLCFLFSDKQVLTQLERMAEKERKEKETEQEPERVPELVTDDIF